MLSNLLKKFSQKKMITFNMRPSRTSVCGGSNFLLIFKKNNPIIKCNQRINDIDAHRDTTFINKLFLNIFLYQILRLYYSISQDLLQCLLVRGPLLNKYAIFSLNKRINVSISNILQ